MVQQLALTSRGLRLAAKAWGPPEGPPVLALHGWLDNANSFDRLLPLLPELRVVALDLPGHGASAHRSADAAYHFVDWVADVIGAAAALGWERFALVGHSMGAGIAALVAGAYPERVSRLVLLDGLGPLTGPEAEAPQRLAAHLTEMQRLQAKVAPVYRSRASMAARLAKVVPNLSETRADLLLERGTRAVEGGVTWCADPRLRGTSSQLMSEPQVLAYMRRIACPTLLVRPNDGYPAPEALLRPRLEAVPQMQLVRVPGGHHVHLEQPERVAPALQHFFAAPPTAA